MLRRTFLALNGSLHQQIQTSQFRAKKGIDNAFRRHFSGVAKTKSAAAKPPASAPAAKKSLFAKYPFTSQLALCTAKTSFCDLLAQVALEGRDFGEIDWGRNGELFFVKGFTSSSLSP